MKMTCYEKGDRRIHVDYDDDGSMMNASLLTNPAKGFRRFIKALTLDELKSALNDGYEKTWESRP